MPASRTCAALRTLLAGTAVATLPLTAMSEIDVLAVWDFSRPEVSEARFRALAGTATGDDAAILQTQIARTYGLRRRFDEARAILAPVGAGLPRLGPEARARYHLEYGRTWVSATHPVAEKTPEAREAARQAYLAADEIARENGLDYLAIDALHMLPFVETDAERGLQWNRQALDVLTRSSQPEARQWERALRNNIGYSLHQLGRYEEALAMFQSNIAASERAGNPARTRVAWWMVAWTLRSLGRLDEALAIQLRLERENRADGTPDEHVFEELVHLYKAKGDVAKERHYGALHQQQKKASSK